MCDPPYAGAVGLYLARWAGGAGLTGRTPDVDNGRMGQDQLGISSMLQSVIHVMAAAASLTIVLCIALVVVSVVAVARGQAKSWNPD